VVIVKRLQRLDYIVGLLGAMIMFTFWLVVATFPSFYFFNPLGQANTLRRFELIFSTIGWIGISTLAPIALFAFASGARGARHFLPVFALFYPLSLAASQITSYVQTGSAYLSYLRNFPIFVLTDLILPVLILFIWHDLKERPGEKLLQP
jgi:hypothetical protein